MLEAVFSGTGPPGALKICVLGDEEYYPWNPSAYLQEYNWELFNFNRLNSVPIVQELVKRDFDVFFNMCDSSWYEPFPGPEVIKILENAEVAFTGADSAFYDPSREDMKKVCRTYGILTPGGVEACDEKDIERAAATLCFPLIIKIPNSFGSTGIERSSRVETYEALLEKTKQVIDKYNGALIEEFIEGREFTVLVAENPDDALKPKVYHPVEFLFPPGESFKHFEMKWKDYELMKAEPCRDPELADRLMEAGRKLFVGLNGISYGRCDMRVDAMGEVFVLEINPNCGILFGLDEPGSADYVLLNDPEGHSGFLERIFKSALARQKRLRSRWYVRHNPERGYALYARRAINPDEIILELEKHPQTLVSLSTVQRSWEPEQQQIFLRDAYPLTDDVWVWRSDNPAEWTPINHSCDPNAWWNGLDVTARRAIEAGEEITLDYATFHNELMPEFSCMCEVSDCRKIIRGNDYLQPFVERYEGHVSDYVRKKRVARRL
jgi:D-alanine-D-alanine ligase-like ATP-grasp enzyme